MNWNQTKMFVMKCDWSKKPNVVYMYVYLYVDRNNLSMLNVYTCKYHTRTFLCSIIKQHDKSRLE